MNALVVQCGGPTAVINASLAAVAAGWQRAGHTLYGARMGTQGLAAGQYVPLPPLDPPALERLAAQPAAALGSGRFVLTDEAIESALAALTAARIATLFLIGGNGTMGAALRLAQAAPHLTVIGIPKTVDNDLHGTDTAPGYGSAARYTAFSVHEALLDLRAMANFDQVVVVETMGRHTGWIAAAAALARTAPGDGPHLLLLPEVPLDEEELLARIAAIHRREGICVVVAAEGARNRAGEYLAEKLGDGGDDGRGQRVLSMASGVAAYIGQRVPRVLGLRCRQLRPNTLQRASAALASPVDRRLAWMVGAEAVALALQGDSGLMAGLARSEDGGWTVRPVPLADVAGRERALPAHFLDPDRLDVTPAFSAYAAPLIGEPVPAPLIWS